MGAISALTMLTCTAPAQAALTFYEDREDWEAATGAYSTVSFVEYPSGTWIFEQYAHLGVHFVDGADIVRWGPTTYPRDGYGIDGNNEIHLLFDAPMTSLALDFPGIVALWFYRDGQLLHATDRYGGGGVGFFIGFTLSEAFDEVVIADPGDQVFIDDLHFGPPIPAPSALALLGLAGARIRRNRWRTVRPSWYPPREPRQDGGLIR